MPGLPPLTSHQLPLTRLPFSSQQFVKRLEGAGLKRGVATELMKLTKGLLGREEQRAQREILNKQDLENVRRRSSRFTPRVLADDEARRNPTSSPRPWPN